MNGAMNAAVYVQGDVYWRIGAKRKSPQGIPYRWQASQSDDKQYANCS